MMYPQIWYFLMFFISLGEDKCVKNWRAKSERTFPKIGQCYAKLINWNNFAKFSLYFASRKAIEDAQVVVIPYNTLLHSSTREACGINLKNSVVIIDEAHNVLETIAHIHSAEVNWKKNWSFMKNISGTCECESELVHSMYAACRK